MHPKELSLVGIVNLESEKYQPEPQLGVPIGIAYW